MKLLEHINRIINDTDKWKYYYMSKDYHSFEEVELNASEFIEDYLERGKKLEFYDKTVLRKILRDKRRCIHTASIFFTGIVFYHNIGKIKLEIDRFLNRIDESYEEFIYYWFLVCLFHDFGYGYEEKKYLRYCQCKLEILRNQTLDSNLELDSFIPSSIIESWEEYLRYRKGKDHGILGGIEYYYNRYKTYYYAKKESNQSGDQFTWKNLLWNKESLFKDHLIISWTILAHNIWFANQSDNYEKQLKMKENYSRLGMNSLIITEPQIINRKYPLLFLLSLVDTIDPIKNEDVDINLRFSFANNIQVKSSNEKYLDMIEGQRYWLGITTEKHNNHLQIDIT